MELWVGIEEIKEALIVEELAVPFLQFVIAEVVPQWHQQDLAAVKLGFLSVLVKQKLCPVEGAKRGFRN